MESPNSLLHDINVVNPTHVFNAVVITGRPNVDWCESHKMETIRVNVVGTLTLTDMCRENGVVLINYATGCIFEYDLGHQVGSGVGFKGEDSPNFVGSFYSKTKVVVWCCYELMILRLTFLCSFFLMISTMTHVRILCDYDVFFFFFFLVKGLYPVNMCDYDVYVRSLSRND